MKPPVATVAFPVGPLALTTTVPDDGVSKQIESFAGHRVELEYEEHKGVPSSCFGDTQYFVVGVKKTD